MRTLTALFSILLFVSLTAWGQQFQSSYSNINEIQLSTGSADCEIIKSANAQVGLELYHNLDGDYEPIIIERDNKLVLKDNQYRGNANMRWVLRVPADIDIKYTAGSGDLTVKDVDINLTSITGSGDISISNVAGVYRSNTGSGDIELMTFSGEISANTGSGDISASGFNGEGSLNTGSGDVEMSDVRASLKVNTGSGDIEIDNLELTSACAFNAGSGTVEVSLGATPTHDLSINSGSGNSILKRNGHNLNADIVMSASKERGEIIAPYEFDREETREEGRKAVVTKYVSVGSGDKVVIKIGTGSGKAVIR